jgi:NTP pyrophosphatase (non-canonical NTP hydrolase)
MDTRAVMAAFDEIAVARGWQPLHSPRNLAAAVALEAAELLQLFQWRADAEPIDAPLRQRIGEEASDVLLYLLALCDRVGIELDDAVTRKIAANRQRFLPPPP